MQCHQREYACSSWLPVIIVIRAGRQGITFLHRNLNPNIGMPASIPNLIELSGLYNFLCFHDAPKLLGICIVAGLAG